MLSKQLDELRVPTPTLNAKVLYLRKWVHYLAYLAVLAGHGDIQTARQMENVDSSFQPPAPPRVAPRRRTSR